MLDQPIRATPPPEVAVAGALPRVRRLFRLRALWFASILVPLLAFAFAAWLAWDNVMSETRLRMLRTADILHEHALRAVQVQESLLAATQAHVAGLDWQQIGQSESVWRFLRALTFGSPSSGIGLVAPDGRMVVTGRAAAFPMAPLDLSERDYVRRIREGRQGTFIGEVVEASVAGFTHFSVAVPRLAADGQPDGGLIVSGFSPSFFTDFYARFIEQSNDFVALLRLDGAVLASQPGLSSWRLPAESPLLQTVQRNGAEGVVDLVGVDGVRRFIAYRRVPNTQLAVVYGVDYSSIVSTWHARLLPIGLVFALAAEALLVLTALTARAARREAEALALAAQETAAARAEAESRAAAEAQLRRIEQLGALGKLSAGVAHDFNNLVNSVGTASRIMRDNAGDAVQVRRLAALMEEATERGARITRRMLDFARRAPDGAGSFAVGTSVEAVCSLLAETLPRDISLEWNVPEGMPPARGDRLEFETVIVNLVTNARDAMPNGGAIFVSAMLDSGAVPHIHISVADTGEGMPPEVLARAGEPFFTTKSTGEGTGLGLAMARRFAEKDKGNLAIDSVPGQGTTVTLRLPVPDTAE